MTEDPNIAEDRASPSAWVRSVAVGLLLLGFCVPAAGFVASTIQGRDGVSETEKRTLADLPAWSGDVRGFTDDMDRFLEDNFGFRLALIRMAREIRDNLGEDPSNVVFGQDGWLFLGGFDYRDEFEGEGPWTEAQARDWVESFAEVKATLQARDIPFAAVIGVDKVRAYPEYVPRDWREGERRFRSRVHAISEASGAQTGLVDAEPLIDAAKADGIRTFWKRDTHWTPTGTYGLAMAVMDLLDPARVLPRFRPAPAAERTPTQLFDLDAMAGFETSQEPPVMAIQLPARGPGGFARLDPQRADGKDVGQFATLRLGGLNENGGRLVIVSDSFGDAMVEHFYPSYNEIIRIHHGAHLYDVGLDAVLAFDPDAVLFVTAERQAPKKPRPFLSLGTTP